MEQYLMLGGGGLPRASMGREGCERRRRLELAHSLGLAGLRPTVKHAPCLAKPGLRVIQSEEAVTSVSIWDTA
jgi:hypothetical protein